MHARSVFAFFVSLLLALPAYAQEQAKPDDIISFDLSAEDWVATKTAHVLLDVEAAVNASSAGSIRADMTKAINETAKADWRLTGFNRSMDQTGMERWSVAFEARLPESSLNGLTETVKKASKAGMQIRVSGIDFSPSRDELEAARAALRVRLMKQAGEQLTAINGALPGRTYRISQITFDTDTPAPMPVQMFRKGGAANNVALMETANVGAAAPQAAAQDISQKMALTAHVTCAALPPVAAK